MATGPRPASAPQPAPRRRHDPVRVERAAHPPQTPVLLRLPDLYPSEVVDEAVARLSTPSTVANGTKSAAGAAAGGRSAASRNDGRGTNEHEHEAPSAAAAAGRHSQRREPVASEAGSPSRWGQQDMGAFEIGPARDLPRPLDWTSRIIVSGIVIAVLACALVVYQRAAEERRARSSVREAPMPTSDNSAHQEAPAADAGPGAVASGDPLPVKTLAPDHQHHQHASSPSSSQEIPYPARPVSYETPLGVPAAAPIGTGANDSSTVIPATMTTPAQATTPNGGAPVEPYMPRTLRPRPENSAPTKPWQE